MDEIKVMLDVPIMNFIYNAYPISFISIVGATFGWFMCFIPARLNHRYGSQRIERLYDMYIILIERKAKM